MLPNKMPEIKVKIKVPTSDKTNLKQNNYDLKANLFF